MAREFDTFARAKQILGSISTVLPAGEPCPLGTRRCESLTKIVAGVAAGELDLGLIPAAKTDIRDAWWPLLLTPKAANVKITGLVGNLYALERTERPFMFDRAVAAFATTGPVASTWLKTVLQKHGVAFFKQVDSTAAAGGEVWFLVELSQKIVNDRDKVFSLEAELNGVKVKFAGLLGGYNIPKSAPSKILPLAV